MTECSRKCKVCLEVTMALTIFFLVYGIFSILGLCLCGGLFVSLAIKFYHSRKKSAINAVSTKPKQIHLSIIIPSLLSIGSFSMAIFGWFMWYILILNDPNSEIVLFVEEHFLSNIFLLYDRTKIDHIDLSSS